MLNDLLGRGMDRNICYERVDCGGGYDDYTSIGYYISTKREISNKTGRVAIKQEVKRRNPGSCMYDDLVDRRTVALDDLEEGRGLVKVVLGATLGNITHVKDRRTWEFRTSLSLRRELKFEYLYYRENYIKLKTELEYAKREVPTNQREIEALKTELVKMNAGLSRVRGQIQEIDEKYPLINMEKEMMKTRKQENDDFDGYVSIFEQLFDSSNRLSILEEKLEAKEKSSWDLQKKIDNIEINRILLKPWAAISDSIAVSNGMPTLEDEINDMKDDIFHIESSVSELSRKISAEKKLNGGLRKLVVAETDKRNAFEDKEEVSARRGSYEK